MTTPLRLGYRLSRLDWSGPSPTERKISGRQQRGETQRMQRTDYARLTAVSSSPHRFPRLDRQPANIGEQCANSSPRTLWRRGPLLHVVLGKRAYPFMHNKEALPRHADTPQPQTATASRRVSRLPYVPAPHVRLLTVTARRLDTSSARGARQHAHDSLTRAFADITVITSTRRRHVTARSTCLTAGQVGDVQQIKIVSSSSDRCAIRRYICNGVQS